MRTLHLDFETRSTLELPKVGVHKYAEDPSTGIWCFSYRFDDDPVGQWKMGDEADAWVEVVEHVAERGRVVAHNAGFERTMWNAYPDSMVHLSIEQQDCTMARAQVMGLPASLDMLGQALSTGAQKDKQGYSHMMKMCRPRRIEDDGTVVWWDSPEDLDRLVRYCDQDVLTECDIDKLLPPLTQEERLVWQLDQYVNDRGVQIDTDMVAKAQACADEAIKRANKQIWLLTDGVVKKVTEAGKIVTWIRGRGIPCESIAEGEHEGLIVCSDMFDDPAVEAVIRLRAASAKAFKFPAMLASVCKDGRIRGSLGYHGTVQGRWIGRGVQFHNMKRVDTDEEAADVALAVQVLGGKSSATQMVDKLELLFDSPLETLSLCTRAAVVAPAGKKLVGGDFSNIEGRICAWMAGEQWKLQAFQDYDTVMPEGVGHKQSDGSWRKGPDLYKVTAADILGISVLHVSKPQRQETGKITELSFQFQGAIGAYKKQGVKYGVRLPDWRIKEFVIGWRAKNSQIVLMWKDLQDAAIEAVSAPGMVVPCLADKVRYVSNGDFLFCRLPSGRVISYASPSVAWKTKTVIIDGDEVEFNRRTVSYWGMHKGWRQLDLYGGAQCAHVVSGAARDVLVAGMFRLEEAGYPIVLTIHDEALSEVDKAFGSADDYRRILMQKEPWFAEVPIAATAWEDIRYVK